MKEEIVPRFLPAGEAALVFNMAVSSILRYTTMCWRLSGLGSRADRRRHRDGTDLSLAYDLL